MKKYKESLWAMYSAGMEAAATIFGRGIPDARTIFLAGVDAGVSLAKRTVEKKVKRAKTHKRHRHSWRAWWESNSPGWLVRDCRRCQKIQVKKA